MRYNHMNHALWRPALLVGLLTALLACASPAADSRRIALEDAIQRWLAAVTAGDTSALTTLMTEDVELTDGAKTVTGREAAIATLRDAATRGRLVATTRELEMNDDEAWHTATVTQIAKNGDVHARGVAKETWQRVDGGWKLRRREVTGAIDPGVSLTRPSTKEPVLDERKKP